MTTANTGPDVFMQDVRALGERLDMPPALLDDPAVMAEYVLPGLVTGFLDGEAELVREDPKRPLLQLWFGKKGFSSGRMVIALNQFREDGYDRDPLLLRVARTLGDIVGAVTADIATQRDMLTGLEQLVPGLGALISSTIPIHRYDMSPLPSTIQVVDSEVELFTDGPREQLSQPPRRVLHYGPSTQGRFLINELLSRIVAGGPPMDYTAAAKGPFIPSYLWSYMELAMARALFTPDEKKLAGLNLRTNVEGLGITSSLLALHEPGTTDLVIASGLYQVDAAELAVGFENAFTLLGEGGGLAIAWPHETRRDHVNSAQVLDMIADSGFNVDQTTLHTIGPLHNPRLQGMGALFVKS